MASEPSTTIIRYSDYWIIAVQLNGHWLAQMKETLEQQEERERLYREGKLTKEEIFGTPISAADLRTRLFDMHPEMAAKYPLPKHWHWMGPREKRIRGL